MNSENKVYVVGIGPGGAEFMTEQAKAALAAADVICGYRVYVDLVSPLFPQKQVYSTLMTKEIERCRRALQMAKEGKTVAMVCSGDAGVYGMAAPLLQLCGECPEVEIEIVPGITAALSGAAVLGAPLGHDFCIISLSDLLTPWAVIETRLQCAAKGDFVVCLYNPCSKSRKDYLNKACKILLRAGKSPETVCGYVQNIGRRGQKANTLSLSALQNAELDMFTTVFIGNSNTQLSAGKMITPRGYEQKCVW